MAYDLETIGKPIPREEKYRFFESFNQLIGNRQGIFPGFHAVTLLKRHIPEIIENDYLACEKSDGTRALLYIMDYYNRAIGFLIDRKLEVFEIIDRNVMSFGCDFVFDGEFLITKDNKPTFTIFDTIYYNNSLVVNLSLIERLDFAKTTTKLLSQLFNFRVTTKMMYKSYGFAEAYHTRESLAHECDGLIFTKVHAPYVYGTCPVLYKWKPPYLNTIDFLMEYMGEGTYSLMCLGRRKGNEYLKIGYFFFSFLEDQKTSNDSQKKGEIIDSYKTQLSKGDHATLEERDAGRTKNSQPNIVNPMGSNTSMSKKETCFNHKKDNDELNSSPDIHPKRKKDSFPEKPTRDEEMSLKNACQSIPNSKEVTDNHISGQINETHLDEKESKIIEATHSESIRKTDINTDKSKLECSETSKDIKSRDTKETVENNTKNDVSIPFEQKCPDPWSIYDGKIGEFRFNEDLLSIDIDDDFTLTQGAWELLRIRHDKDMPNSSKVVSNIFLSMEENITYDYLCANFKEMRRQWKEREKKRNKRSH